MLKHYLKTQIRGMRRKPFSAILLFFSLSICLAASYITYNLAKYELSFESFNNHSNQVYRVERHEQRNGLTVVTSATTFPALSNLVKREFPSVSLSARIMRRQGVIRYQDNKYNEYNIYNVDNDLIKILAIDLIKGDPTSALINPKTAIISTSYAAKYFGADDPMDKDLRLNNEVYVITGVFEDYPANSHLKFDILFSYSTFSSYTRFEESWLWNNFYTYVQLHTSEDPEKFTAQLDRYFDDKQAKLNKDPNVKTSYSLQPIRDINLGVHVSDEISKTSNNQQKAELLFIGSLVLFIISILNYGNISVNNILDKSKEMNLRRVFGAGVKSLLGQLTIESFLTCIFTIVMATFIIWLISINQMIDYPIIETMTKPNNLLVFIGVYVACFLLITSLSSLQLIKIVSNTFVKNKASMTLSFRKILLGIQLIISFVIFHFTLTSIKQYNHLQNADVAFNTDGIVIVDPPNLTDSIYDSKLITFKNEVVKYPNIDFVTIASSVPGEPIIDYYENTIKSDRVTDVVKERIYYVYADEMYFKVFDLNLLAGRYLRMDNPVDEESVVISKKTAVLLGYNDFEEALGAPFYTKTGYYTIVGVIDDYYHESFKKEVDPIVFLLNTDAWGYFCFKGHVNNSESLSYLQSEWSVLVPDSPFDYSYMDQKYYKQYEHEQRLGTSFLIFSILALLMIILGMFGIISLMIKKNLKAMAIKKILGATQSNLSIGLMRDFAILIVVALVVSIPLSNKVVTYWLNTYSSKVDLTTEMLMLPGLLTCLIVFFSILVMVVRNLQNTITIIRND